MFSTFFTVALFIAPAIQGAFAEFAINSPDLVQCQTSKISWEPTKGPYNLIIVPAATPCGDALVEVGDFNTTSIQWKTTIAAGTQVQLSLVDADDNEAWSKTITIGGNADGSCLPGKGAAAGNTPAPTPLNVAGGSKSSSTASASQTIVPVGAANAGILGGTSGALTARQLSTPLLAFTAMAAVFALSL
ncbi:hypothetical protein B0H34DRAFT_801577 [Crassisporium funariophilum]|nr:hypothetical protein B0H34DRAFT_801577 [Crassisporium funariophilum]